MKVLNKHDLELFTAVCTKTQAELQQVLTNTLKKIYNNKKIVSTPNYVYAVGDLPICLIAHTDTVWPTPTKEVYYDNVKNVLFSPQCGLGDDRTGVFLILKILKAGPRPSVLFCADEEKGCIGAEKLVQEVPVPFDDFKYIIELDRANTNDCVFYCCDNNKKFEEYVESFGFVTKLGSYTDIDVIMPAWDCAGVNLSVGYIREHTTQEIVYVDAMLSTFYKVLNMLKDSHLCEKFKFEHKVNTLLPKMRGFDYNDFSCYCAKCNKKLTDIETSFPVLNLKGDGYDYFCGTCIASQGVEWCTICGDPFQQQNNEHICLACIEDIINENNTTYKF